MKVTVNGREAEMRPVAFEAVKEPWQEYVIPELRLKVRIRLVLKRLMVVEGQKTPDGLPMISAVTDNSMDAVPLSEVEMEAMRQ